MMDEGELVPQLEELRGPHMGRVHAIPYGEHVIGRGGDADVQLQDKDVSRRHARLEVTREGVRVHDLGSKNGVFVNGTRVTDPMLLVHGDTMSFGHVTLSVSHPASHVASALNAAGEGTVTTTKTSTDLRRIDLASLRAPLLGVVFFAALAIALFFLS